MSEWRWGELKNKDHPGFSTVNWNAKWYIKALKRANFTVCTFSIMSLGVSVVSLKSPQCSKTPHWASFLKRHCVTFGFCARGFPSWGVTCLSETKVAPLTNSSTRFSSHFNDHFGQRFTFVFCWSLYDQQKQHKKRKNTLNDKIERGRVILLLTVTSELNSKCQDEVLMLVSGVLPWSQACCCKGVPGRQTKSHGPISDQVGPLLRVYKTIKQQNEFKLWF